jgi:hypothetical protein
MCYRYSAAQNHGLRVFMKKVALLQAEPQLFFMAVAKDASM